jgi:hypothetical protein
MLHVDRSVMQPAALYHCDRTEKNLPCPRLITDEASHGFSSPFRYEA